MTPVPLLQYTDVRTRVVDGKPLIGLRHRAKTAGDMPVTTVWVEMPPEDVKGLIKTLQQALDELDKGARPAGHEVGNG